MKRLIFSIFTDGIDTSHKSSNDRKLSQFKKYRHHLEKAHRDYAEMCGAEYALFTTPATWYDEIQFQKILHLEALAESYDEVLYLDFDVVPQTDVNFFEVFDLNNICATSMDRTPDRETLYWAVKENKFDKMNMYCKGCAKNAMLSLEDMSSDASIINTGVVGGNKHSLGQLKFRERLDSMRELLSEAKEDNVFPVEIHKNWFDNNEIFFSYLVERYDIPFTDIGLVWNFFLCKMYPEQTKAAHFLHHSNKEFERSFGEI